MRKLTRLSLLIKPASGLCNMRCAYCFYADETRRRGQYVPGLMSEDTASRLIASALDAVAPGGRLSFAFQGGEPTLAGLDFFRFFCNETDRLNAYRIPVDYSIQTNGLLLDASWAAFLKERSFLTGLSVDGDWGTHNTFRTDPAGQGTYDRVLGALSLLKESRADVNLLCVVHAAAAAAPKKVYRALKSLGTGYLQFIPCLDPLEAPRGSMPWSLTPEAYGRFLCAVFDLWEKDWKAGQYCSVRQFEDWVLLAMGQPAGTCASCGACGSYLVAEADGSLYPCDFYALDEWKLGTAGDSLPELMEAERMRAFRLRSAEKPARCRACAYYALCRGGCPRDWFAENGQPENWFCPAFRHFFAYAGPRLRNIAAGLAARTR